MSDLDLVWYAVAAEPQREAVAETALRQIGLSVYIPRRLAAVRRRGRLHHVRRPLMPGYVFVGIDPGREPWMCIEGCSGVAGIIGFGSPLVPARFRSQDVFDLRFAEWRGHHDDDRLRTASLRKGTKVRMRDLDPDIQVAGRVGRIVRMLAHDRIVLYFDRLHAQLPAVAIVRRLDEFIVL